MTKLVNNPLSIRNHKQPISDVLMQIISQDGRDPSENEEDNLIQKAAEYIDELESRLELNFQRSQDGASRNRRWCMYISIDDDDILSLQSTGSCMTKNIKTYINEIKEVAQMLTYVITNIKE